MGKRTDGKFDPKEIEESDVGAENKYVRKTNAEIRELALGARSGTIFGSWMLHESDQNLLGSVFMPLMLMSEIEHKKLLRDEVVHFYGRISDAAERSINGYPMFFAFSCINKEDCERLSAAMKALDAFMVQDDEE